MKSLILSLTALFSLTLTYAQTKLTRENIQKDSLIKVQIIDPAVQEAQGEAPDWNALTSEITKKYDATYADRTITKGIIYFTYGKDWPAFTAAIVKYTVKYEDIDDLKRMNKNANYILQYSADKKELMTALGWSKHTVDNEPSNEDYKKTYADLTAKLNSK